MLNVLWTAKQLCIQPATANIRILKETLGAVSGFSLWFFVKRKKKKKVGTWKMDNNGGLL